MKFDRENYGDAVSELKRTYPFEDMKKAVMIRKQ